MEEKTALKPIFIREYPPFALAMGSTFLSWLTGSIAFDSFTAKDPDILIGILFGLVFIAAAAAALSSWTSVFTIARIGLYLKETGITHISSGWLLFTTRSRTLSWQDIEEIKLEKDILMVIARDKEKTFSISIAGLLENPDWIVERSQAWITAVKRGDTRDEVLQPLVQLETQMAEVTCQACGGNVDIAVGAVDKAVCRFCGSSQNLGQKVKDALQRLSRLIADLPAAHRQFQEKALRRFAAEGKKHRRTILGVGWGTAAVWLLFALVEFISTMVRKEQDLNIVFISVLVGLAFLSVLTAYILAAFIRRAFGKFSLPMQALAPIETGGTARCRLCGADLPDKGVLRRCDYCASDSIVVGEELAKAEQAAGEALRQAQKAVRTGTETAARLLDSAAYKMQIFTYTQFFWLHIPILTALDGSTGMLYRLTGIGLAMLIGNFASTILGMRWLNKSRD
jgi:Zn finger protein HypA/HybF involved in hydrogenase expression